MGFPIQKHTNWDSEAFSNAEGLHTCLYVRPCCAVSHSCTTCQCCNAAMCWMVLSDIEVILFECWPSLVGSSCNVMPATWARQWGTQHVHGAVPLQRCCGMGEELDDMCLTWPKCLAIALVFLWVCSSFEVFLRSLYPLNSSLWALTTSFHTVFYASCWCVLASWASGRAEEELGLLRVLWWHCVWEKK